MSDSFTRKSGQKQDWALTARSFHRLLEWLGGGGEPADRSYLEIRRRLIAYFDRKNCRDPEDLADEALNRVARRLEEEGTIDSDVPARYCYIVARFVFLEHRRADRKRNDALNELRRQPLRSGEAPDAVAQRSVEEQTLECLRRCIGSLDRDSRQLILGYYTGEARAKIDARRALADGHRITLNALGIRACRIRGTLGACVKRCMDER
jgi:DNA-directed RNA polymerase specialized sigma24 family protein